jgi:hypothetical protein
MQKVTVRDFVNYSRDSKIPPCLIRHSVFYCVTPCIRKDILLISSISATGGSFVAGSIRWLRVAPRHARFDIVTYWTRSFSVFKNPVVGQKIHITAQNSVQFDPGDGTTQYLIANVTKVSTEEDWFEAVTVIYHSYEQVETAPILRDAYLNIPPFHHPLCSISRAPTDRPSRAPVDMGRASSSHTDRAS